MVPKLRLILLKILVLYPRLRCLSSAVTSLPFAPVPNVHIIMAGWGIPATIGEKKPSKIMRRKFLYYKKFFIMNILLQF